MPGPDSRGDGHAPVSPTAGGAQGSAGGESGFDRHMDVVDLSRFQFASTSIFHFFFVSLTVGLAFLIAVMETIAYLHHEHRQTYDNLANFFGHLFLINFAVGVVTGIVQEFQFGMNWSEYSRFVGNIFGVPLALEVLMAFFLESTFIALWWFGKDRLPRWVRLASISAK